MVSIFRFFLLLPLSCLLFLLLFLTKAVLIQLIDRILFDYKPSHILAPPFPHSPGGLGSLVSEYAYFPFPHIYFTNL